MIKKLLLTISIVLLTATTCFAQDYWVFIRTYDRPGLTASDDVGRSKAGDIVLVEPAVEGQTPTETEQNEWLILTVSDLTQSDITILSTESDSEPFIEDRETIYKPKAFRTRKFDFALAKIEGKVGFNSKSITRDKFIEAIKTKTMLDYVKYEAKRIAYAYLQNPLEKIGNVIIPRAFASTVVSKICAVGDNCADENYNTLVAWEDAKDGNLVGATTIQESDLYNDDGDITTANFIIDGSTTSTDYYMFITAPVGERHTGVINTGATLYSTDANEQIDIDDENVMISWLEFDMSGSTATLVSVIESEFETIFFYNNLVYNYTGCNTGSACGISGETGNISNNLFSNLGGASERAIDKENSAGNLYIANNTIFDVDIAFQQTSATINVFNNFIDDNGTDGDAFGVCGAGSNNSTNDATADDDADCSSGAVINYQMDTVVVNTTTNFHLLNTATSVIDAGVDLVTSYGANIDIDNRDRDALGDTWDIGFDEYVSATRRRQGQLVGN